MIQVDEGGVRCLMNDETVQSSSDLHQIVTEVLNQILKMNE